MMNKKELNFWFNRISRLLLHPSQEWDKIREEPTEKNTLFRKFFIPFCVTVAVAVWFISLLWLNFFYALGYALIHLASNLLGTYVVVLLISEYLNGKIMAKYLGHEFIDAANVVRFQSLRDTLLHRIIQALNSEVFKLQGDLIKNFPDILHFFI